MFRLVFHLPYHVLRTSKKAKKDHRRNSKDHPLRHSRDVSFLEWNGTGASSFLYQAQISCLVAGTDESKWIAYGFVDSYFEAEDNGRETVQQYHDSNVDDEGLHTDPLTAGFLEAEKPIWDPRVYFLAVLQIRITHIKNEWQNLILKLEGSFREYIYVSHLLRVSRDLLILINVCQ